jgi:hypothetical protein
MFKSRWAVLVLPLYGDIYTGGTGRRKVKHVLSHFLVVCRGNMEQRVEWDDTQQMFYTKIIAL